MSKYLIGKVASILGCGVDTIRFYEKQKVVPQPPRTNGGQRIYDNDAVERLRIVVRGRELGFSLEEIRRMLALADRGDDGADELKALTLDHLMDIRNQIEALQSIEAQLAGLVDAYESGDVGVNPILGELTQH